ncbi:transposase [Escherichia coli]|nr:transposase [Escherichia coli]
MSEGSVVAIDGKSLRGTYDKSKRNAVIHRVSAFSAENRLVLGQVKTGAKSNEITAIPERLQLLELKGCLVTLDAMGCQHIIAREILKKKAGYLLALKGNQGKLAEAFDNGYSPTMWLGERYDSYSSQEKGHGREDTRCCIVSHDLTALGDLAYEWSELSTIGIVLASRQEGETAVKSEKCILRYYISSVTLTAKELLEATRAHWSVENQLHWRLDMGMREDECQIVRGEAGENLAVCRHIAMNLLTAENSFKAGIKRKQKRAGRKNEYLSLILAGCGPS